LFERRSPTLKFPPHPAIQDGKPAVRHNASYVSYDLLKNRILLYYEKTDLNAPVGGHVSAVVVPETLKIEY